MRVAVDIPSARAEWALGVLLSVLGVRWTVVPPGSDADLAYGRPRDGVRAVIRAGAQGGWDNPRPTLDRFGSLPYVRLPDGHAPSADEPATVVPFDAVYATYAALTAPWEAVDPVDEVGCPIGAESWLARQGLLERPVVHDYAAALRTALEAAGLPVEPPRSASIVLTHDVDSNFGHLFARRESLALLRRDLAARRPDALRRLAGLGRRALGPYGSDPNDRWEEWLELAASHGGRPTFFVASYGLFDAGSLRHDPPYDARRPEVRRVLRELVRSGAEVGIHFSLQARAGADQVRAECDRLADVLGAPVRSARHHWWAVGRPPERVLGWQSRAGVEVDCSLGYNDVVGFRRGIAAPFHPFDRDADRPLGLWELPTVAMDLAVHDGRRTAGDAEAILLRLLESARSVGGALVLDWHAHALNPRRLNGAGAGLRALLDSPSCEGLSIRTPLELVRGFQPS